MMMLRKDNQTAARKIAQPTLAERIDQIRAEAEEYIDQRTAELKSSPEGKLIPLGVLRQMITKADTCACRAAKRLLEEKQ